MQISKVVPAKSSLPAPTGLMANLVLKHVRAARKSFTRLIVLVCGCLVISACLIKKPIEEVTPAPSVQMAPAKPRSAAPIVSAPKDIVVLAQTALNKLGYNIGEVDGLWGPRSAKAIRKFEAEQKIWSANGHISKLNLAYLRKLSGAVLAAEKPKMPVVRKLASGEILGITAKLDKQGTLEAGPQLIIVDQEYDVFSKPNPYSATLTKLPAGTGIYIVARESNWYEIESLDQLKGYVPVD